jgi:threonine dehydrogenase-like Zn-dependent dehydrogenase
MPDAGHFDLVDRPLPTLAADEALVKVANVAICHTDIIIKSGRAGHVHYPVIPGHEFSGVVERCGPAARYIKPGDRVAVHTVIACGQCPSCRRGDTMNCEHYDELGSKRDGGFAEYCAMPAKCLFKLPDQVSLAEGALMEPLANAVSVLRWAQVHMGDRVVVIGPGPIGLLATQLARLLQPSILVLVGTRDERLALGQHFGATHTVNIKKAGAVDHLKEILQGKGADVVLECAGTASSLNLAMDIAGWRGRIAVEGVFDVDEMVPISPYKLLLSRAASIIGVNGWLTTDFGNAVDLMARGMVNVNPLITHTFTLSDWQAAFAMVTEHKSEALKVEFAF